MSLQKQIALVPPPPALLCGHELVVMSLCRPCHNALHFWPCTEARHWLVLSEEREGERERDYNTLASRNSDHMQLRLMYLSGSQQQMTDKQEQKEDHKCMPAQLG